MTKIDAVQVNLIYLIFNSSNFLVDTNDIKYIKIIIYNSFQTSICSYALSMRMILS